MAIPSARRGERVNVGLIVFLPERLDIRVSDVSKINCLAPNDWSDYVSKSALYMQERFGPPASPEGFLKQFSDYESVLRLSDLGWFSIDSHDHYESEVLSILNDLVYFPREQQNLTIAKTSRINAQIAAEFRKAQILASVYETIEDHKVERNYTVSRSADLKADFAVKNGVYHITSTLDLRRESAHISQATWKAVVLLEAEKTFGKDTNKNCGLCSTLRRNAISGPHQHSKRICRYYF